nr:hypothetical protein [Tanacetum cinerariifolium]
MGWSKDCFFFEKEGFHRFCSKLGSARSLSAAVWHIESSTMLIGIAKHECAVLSPSNNNAAMPLEATFNTISPLERNAADIVL